MPAPAPPRVSGWPVIGSLLPMMRAPIPFLLEQYRHHGPIFEVRVANRSLLILAGPEAATRVRDSGYDDFAAGAMWRPFLGQFGTDEFLLSLDGPAHQARRQLMKRGYSRDFLNQRLTEAVAVVREHIHRVRDQRRLSVTTFFKRVITDVLGRLLASHALGDAIDEIMAFHDELILVTTGLRPKLSFWLPKYRARKQQALERMRRVIEDHRHQPNDPPDLIDMLLTGSDSGKCTLDDAELILATLGPFVAGKDTAALTCGFMLYALLANRDAMGRVQAEVDGLFADGVPTAAALNRSPALNGATLETLRLHPVSPMIMRTAKRDLEFEGFFVPEGHDVIIAASLSHFLNRFYPRPLLFDIDRFGDDRREHKQRGAFAPYGLGPHICLGAAMADTLIKVTMATLLHELRVDLEHPNYKLRTVTAPNPAPDPSFNVLITPRT